MSVLSHDESPYLLKEIPLKSWYWHIPCTISVSDGGIMVATRGKYYKTRSALVIDTIIGSKVRKIVTPYPIRSAKITPDGKKIVTMGDGSHLTIWGVGQPNTKIYSLYDIDEESKWCNCMIMSNDSKMVLLFDGEYFIRAVNLDTEYPSTPMYSLVTIQISHYLVTTRSWPY